MNNLKVFKNPSKKSKLTALVFTFALVTSMSVGCAEESYKESYIYIVQTENGKEIVLSENQYNQLIENDEELSTVRWYGCNFTVTKEQLQEATCQKQKPNSLHK